MGEVLKKICKIEACEYPDRQNLALTGSAFLIEYENIYKSEGAMILRKKESKRVQAMIVRKSRISQLIKKERQRERRACQKEHEARLREVKQDITNRFTEEIRTIRQEYRREIKTLEKENENLKRELDKNYAVYQKVRRREEHLEQLSAEFEDIVDVMNVKVQESLQPFYRTRAKIEHTRRKSDKKHEKVESIFRAIK